MTIDPRIILTILNVAALLAALGFTGWLGVRILRGQSLWPKLLLPILALVFTFAALALALATSPLSFSGSAESQHQTEMDR